MSPRRIRRERAGPQPDPGFMVESWPDGDWVVRPVSGAAAAKTYRCPGCDQEIPPGTPHVVAWPAGAQPFGINRGAGGQSVGGQSVGGRGVGGRGVGERRHWHRPCWQRRMHRRPK
ncbi:MAG: hypothetical protein ACM3ML_15220 [Micromonosporaceae bacterium]